MDKELQAFIAKHGEYFEGEPDAMVLRRDLRRLFDQYAQSMDPEEYASLKGKVEAFREKEKKRLQAEVDALVKLRKQEEAALQTISKDLLEFRKELGRIDKELRKIDDAAPRPVRQKGSWLQSNSVFLALDLTGVVFLYMGIILHHKLTLSYIVMGIACILAGFLFQGSGGSQEPSLSPNLQSMKQELLRRKGEVQQFSKLKKMSLQNRKTIAINKIQALNRQIDVNLARIDECLRE